MWLWERSSSGGLVHKLQAVTTAYLRFQVDLIQFSNLLEEGRKKAWFAWAVCRLCARLLHLMWVDEEEPPCLPADHHCTSNVVWQLRVECRMCCVQLLLLLLLLLISPFGPRGLWAASQGREIQSGTRESIFHHRPFIEVVRL